MPVWIKVFELLIGVGLFGLVDFGDARALNSTAAAANLSTQSSTNGKFLLNHNFQFLNQLLFLHFIRLQVVS